MTIPLSICVVTATTNLARSERCRDSWILAPDIAVDGDQGQYHGTVPMFRQLVDEALADPRHWDLICCFHDDLEILDSQWMDRVRGYFAANPSMGLAGFGGAVGLGDEDIYHTPYRPEQLARKGFRSNMVDAEVHGIRSLLSERVACLDGFSQIGRREFWEGQRRNEPAGMFDSEESRPARPWRFLEDRGMVHHFYDGALGCLAARHGWETWYLPIACKHYGGATAVGDSGYQDWAKTQVSGGDHGFWEQAHRIGYDAFRDQLPLRV